MIILCHFTRDFAFNFGLINPLTNLKFHHRFFPCVVVQPEQVQTLILTLVIQQRLPLSASYFYKLLLLFPFIFPDALSFHPILFTWRPIFPTVLFVFSLELVLLAFWPRALVFSVCLRPIWHLIQPYPVFL